MKASAFCHARATSVVNALEPSVAHGDGARVPSIGQGLMPAVNLRLVAVELPAAWKNSVDFFQQFTRSRDDDAIVGPAARAIVQAGTFAGAAAPLGRPDLIAGESA
jgi:hypothetical protein